MKRFFTWQFLLAYLLTLTALGTTAYFAPKVFASNDFTATNVTFDPATGRLEWDYTGTNITTSQAFTQIQNTTSNIYYWQGLSNYPGVCTSSHCFAILTPYTPDNGVTSVKLQMSGLVSQNLTYPLPLPTSNTPQTVRYDTQVYPLTLSSTSSTTSSTTVSFGSINLPVKSNICVQSMWSLQNDTNAIGLRAWLVMDSVSKTVGSDTIPLSSLGINYTVARNWCESDVSAGTHTFGVALDQFPFRSGDTISIRNSSTMWITAYPTQ